MREQDFSYSSIEVICSDLKIIFITDEKYYIAIRFYDENKVYIGCGTNNLDTSGGAMKGNKATITPAKGSKYMKLIVLYNDSASYTTEINPSDAKNINITLTFKHSNTETTINYCPIEFGKGGKIK